MNGLLWTLQVLLAALFVFGASFRLTMPAEELAPLTPFPLWFIYFISVCEIFGGFGLILPALFRRHTGLVPLAALGLSIIMVGAVVSTALLMDAVMAAIPLIVLLLVAFVAYGRARIVPHGRRRPEAAVAAHAS